MERRVYLQPAYVLHRQPFQNSSLLVDFFCLDYGRVRAVARGARSAKSRYRALLQEFHPVLVSLVGKGELKTLQAVESGIAPLELAGERLFSGLYLNELITRLVMANVEHKTLYQEYQDALLKLQGGTGISEVLRRFELALLKELGYEINLESDSVTRQNIESDQWYMLVPDVGFEQVPSTARDEGNVFLGRHVQELRQLDFTDSDALDAAKRILRIALQAHLGERPIHSRSLFARLG
ncbi:MAG: DNA repair protein RecO [Pseudohongiellaceae bacterium]